MLKYVVPENRPYFYDSTFLDEFESIKKGSSLYFELLLKELFRKHRDMRLIKKLHKEMGEEFDYLLITQNYFSQCNSDKTKLRNWIKTYLSELK